MRQGNLTGSARKLKDGAADLHNLVERWNTLHIDGTNIVNEIARIKLDCMYDFCYGVFFLLLLFCIPFLY